MLEGNHRLDATSITHPPIVFPELPELPDFGEMADKVKRRLRQLARSMRGKRFKWMGQEFKVVPWVDLAREDAYNDATKVVIVVDNGNWYGPYSSPASATKSAWGISTKGDNHRQRVPFEKMRLIKERDWPLARGGTGVSKRHRVAARARIVAALRAAAEVLASPGDAEWYRNLHRRQKGVFYRGIPKSGKGSDMGALGAGLYVTWNRGVAQFFAKGGEVVEYELPANLKLLDAQSSVMAEIKAKMGFKPWEFAAGPIFARAITREAKDLGFDGVISDNPADGLCLFDDRKATISGAAGAEVLASSYRIEEYDSPLDYKRSGRVRRIALIDPRASAPDPHDSYFAEITRTRRYSKSGRKPLKKPKVELVSKGAQPGVVAFLDWHQYGPDGVYIDYMKSRGDMRGRRHIQRLLDHLYKKHKNDKIIHWGKVMNEAAWSLFERYQALEENGYPHTIGSRYF